MENEKIIAGLVSRNEELADELCEVKMDNQRLVMAINFLKDAYNKHGVKIVSENDFKAALKIADMEDKEVELVNITRVEDGDAFPFK